MYVNYGKSSCNLCTLLEFKAAVWSVLNTPSPNHTELDLISRADGARVTSNTWSFSPCQTPYSYAKPLLSLSQVSQLYDITDKMLEVWK